MEWVTGTDISPTGTTSVPAETGTRPSGTRSVPGLIGWSGAGPPSTTWGRCPSRPRRMLSQQSRWFTRPGPDPSQPGHCPSPPRWGGEDRNRPLPSRDGPPPDRDLVRSDRGNESPGRDAVRPDLLRSANVRSGFTNDCENIRNRRAEVRSDWWKCESGCRCFCSRRLDIHLDSRDLHGNAGGFRIESEGVHPSRGRVRPDRDRYRPATQNRSTGNVRLGQGRFCNNRGDVRLNRGGLKNRWQAVCERPHDLSPDSGGVREGRGEFHPNVRWVAPNGGAIRPDRGGIGSPSQGQSTSAFAVSTAAQSPRSRRNWPIALEASRFRSDLASTPSSERNLTAHSRSPPRTCGLASAPSQGHTLWR